MIRPATLADMNDLFTLEYLVFPGDRLSRRSFRHLLTQAHADTLVEERGGRIAGYVVILYKRRSTVARLYSIATHPDFRGQGVAHTLLAAAEDRARGRLCLTMRLEIRKDNHAAEQLYLKNAYQRFGTAADYYEDHMDAWRYQKIVFSC